MAIPKIIHQIWSDKYRALPKLFSILSQTWKDYHPDWEYIFWDDEKMERLIAENSIYAGIYNKFPYDIQRWDMIRYLILYNYGGVYVDLDYECIDSLDDLLKGQSCCLALDPLEHANQLGQDYIITNAFIAIKNRHSFMRQVLAQLSQDKELEYELNDKFNYVLNTTGPYMLTRAYKNYSSKNDIYLLEPKIISPLTKPEVRKCIKNHISDKDLKKKLEYAVAIHYFSGSWL